MQNGYAHSWMYLRLLPIAPWSLPRSPEWSCQTHTCTRTCSISSYTGDVLPAPLCTTFAFTLPRPRLPLSDTRRGCWATSSCYPTFGVRGRLPPPRRNWWACCPPQGCSRRWGGGCVGGGHCFFMCLFCMFFSICLFSDCGARLSAVPHLFGRDHRRRRVSFFVPLLRLA